LLGISLLILCYIKLPESLPKSTHIKFEPGTLISNYLAAISNKRFIPLTGCIGFGFGGFLVYVAGAPDFVFKVMHLSSLQFGWLFIPIVIELTIGSATATKLIGKISTSDMINLSFIIMGTAAIANVIYCEYYSPANSWITIPLILYTFGLVCYCLV
jgi:DHA1 family bicyclomycin/chloramphenicol resistance-like MFS transporter